jgi:AraC-like DNA-binding protein
VQVRYTEPDCAEDAARLFGCPVRFARRRMRIVIPAAELRSAARLANPLIAEQIERFAAALLSRITAATSVAERVADALRAALSAGVRADRGSVARRLGMSDRTMQRGLEAESTTFRAVREDVLRGAVEALLSNSTLKVDAVARSVGFGEMAAFSRAFKRWTGSSPTQYRRRLAQARTPHGRRAGATAPR